MIVPWPSDLPEMFPSEGFSISSDDPRLKTSTETGPPLVRRRGTGAGRPVSFMMITNANGYARTERFWEEDLSYGVNLFMFRDQVLDGELTTNELGQVLLDDDNNPIVIESYFLARMNERPSYIAKGTEFNVSLSLTLVRT